jgi:hypothetical protein
MRVVDCRCCAILLHVLVTKSRCTATAVCGRTSDGRGLPVYIVFNSGARLAGGWTWDYTSDVLDADGNRIKWRFASNEKGSLNEEGCEDYLRNTSAPLLLVRAARRVLRRLANMASSYAMAWAHTWASLCWRLPWTSGSRSACVCPT